MSANGKKLLVIGSGGREHAICWKLAQSKQVGQIFALPGSVGIKQVPKCTNVEEIGSNDYNLIASWCKKNAIDIVIVGPEDPLANGLTDVLRKSGVRCFGPSKAGAQIEADKKWSKDFMQRHGIPTARYQSFTDVAKAKDFIMNSPFNALVVKAAGLAAGKGVVVAADRNEACQAVQELLGEKKYGAAGNTLVVEELLAGEEISVLAFVDKDCVKVMLPAQDHKRLQNDDKGPNTGGMGAYCPCPLISQEELHVVQQQVLEKAVEGLRKEGIQYCGVLYAGMMLTANGPKVLEFNCRFGDPETQVILPLLKSDLYEVMNACCDNRLKQLQLDWFEDVNAVGVIMASAGYPETATKGCLITGIPANKPDQLVFHSGVAQRGEAELVTNGGRVLIVVALRKQLQEAALAATKLCQAIKFEGKGAQFRTDIAAKAYHKNSSKAAETISLSYKQSGVDIDAGEDLVKRIKPLSRGTQRAGVMGALGGFGGLFRLNELSYKNAVICEAVNGVGSKIHLALDQQLYEGIGYDLAAVCANDVLESGAEPVAFLDYIACGKLQVPLAAQIVKGIADGCRAVKCALVGGETAEMPAVYEVGNYDVAGYCVGLLEDGSQLPKFDAYEEGDLLISLPASGLHCSSGFDSILQLLKQKNIELQQQTTFGDKNKTLAQELLTPTRAYVEQVLQLLSENVVKAVAHISSGLLPDVKRILPENFEICLDFGDLKVPEVFGWLAAKLQLTPQSMLQNLNCGIGLVLVVPKTNQSWKKVLKNAKVLGVLKRKLPDLQQKQAIEVRNFDEALQKAAGNTDLSNNQTQLTAAYCHEHQQACNALGEKRAETFVTALGKNLTRVPKSYKDPILVLGTDGVGTKIKIAQQTGKHQTVGIDLVAMCVNDIICNGAEPFTFSSYYACANRAEDATAPIRQSVFKGAQLAGCSLSENHLAEVPLLYKRNVYDLAGFSLGIAEMARILPKKEKIKPGDVLIGLPSSGVHSNGFSLVHAVLKQAGVSFGDQAPFAKGSFADELLKPTRIYVKELTPLIQAGLVKAFAHITGGGLTENIPRVLEDKHAAHLNAKCFMIPSVFGWLSQQGNIKPLEMQRTFNCGVGMVLVVDAQHEAKVLELLQYTERASKIGAVVARKDANAPQVVVENFEQELLKVQQSIGAKRKRVAVLISGSGTNLQALLDASNDSAQNLPADIVLVISNKANVGGLARAERANVPAVVVSHKDFKTREDYDAQLSKLLEEQRIDLICLAGFMRVLSEGFVKKWKGKLINIHPSLLPKHPGLHVQQKALDAGDAESGCTVHFVDEGVDTGAIIVQARVPILKGDDVETLTQRIHKAEHFAFPKALRLLASNEVKLNANGKADVE